MNMKRGLAVAGIVGVVGSSGISAVGPRAPTPDAQRQEIVRQYESDLASAQRIENDRRRAEVVDAINARNAEALRQVEMRPREKFHWIARP